MAKLQGFDVDYFHGKGHFAEDGLQSYLVFQPILLKGYQY